MENWTYNDDYNDTFTNELNVSIKQSQKSWYAVKQIDQTKPISSYNYDQIFKRN